MAAEGDQSCRITDQMYQILRKHQNTPCDIQVIPMPDSFHRVYDRLKQGERKETWSKLSLLIANGFDKLCYPAADHSELSMEVFESDSLACQVWEKTGIELNDVQKEAITRALRNSFQLIQGPPGTGKSVTGAHLAYIFSKTNTIIAEKEPTKKQKRVVLYCGPSNKSVDVVHEKLRCLNGKYPSGKMKILRIYGRTHERKVYRDPCHNLTNETAGDDTNREEDDVYRDKEGPGRCLEEFQKDALHYKIRHACRDIEEIAERLYELRDKGIIPLFKDRKEYKDCIFEAERTELMRDYDIILCTCNETCSPRMLSIAEEGRIAQCIIDECGMAHEPETIAAASLCEHVVLIGDHKQLQPVIKYPQARECGLSKSLFERYATIFENDERLITLEVQYRMHPFICEGPSKCFYEHKLKADETVKSRDRDLLSQSLRSFWPRKGSNFPILFHDVNDSEESLTDSKYSNIVDSHSKCNKTEALVVLEYVKKLVKNDGIQYADIAVLTPYAAQKNVIIDLISKDTNLRNWSNPRVATITESQGDEYNIVILTTVRSRRLGEIKHRKFVQPDRRWMRENLGFLTDDHQVNVGITRAKYGLIIIGNAVLLKYDDTWKSLIKLYEEKGCIK